MAFEMERSLEKLQLKKIKKKKPPPTPPPPPPPPLIFTFLELTIARLRKADKCPVSFRTDKIVFCLIAGYKIRTKLINTKLRVLCCSAKFSLTYGRINNSCLSNKSHYVIIKTNVIRSVC